MAAGGAQTREFLADLLAELRDADGRGLPRYVEHGYGPIKHALDQLDFGDGPELVAWDARAQRYQPTADHAAA